jgi:hypothetical protein
MGRKLGLIQWPSGHPATSFSLDIGHDQPLKSPQHALDKLTSLAEVIAVRLGFGTELVPLK